jgi:hypothetical protein
VEETSWGKGHKEFQRINFKRMVDVVGTYQESPKFDSHIGVDPAEFAKWTSGGHSIDYQNVFLNIKQNSTEQINFDCLRCHGMVFKGTVHDVVEPLNIKGPWKLKKYPG